MFTIKTIERSEACHQAEVAWMEKRNWMILPKSEFIATLDDTEEEIKLKGIIHIEINSTEQDEDTLLKIIYYKLDKLDRIKI